MKKLWMLGMDKINLFLRFYAILKLQQIHT
jgi:hypothetical protein